MAKITLLIAIVFSANALVEMKPLEGLSPKVFTGPEGEKMTIVYVAPKESKEALIKFENFEGSD